MINIISGLTNESIDNTVANLHHLKDHKSLKDYVADLIVNEFDDKRQLYDELLQNKDYLEQVCKQGRDKAREMALVNIGEIKTIIGMD